jgi:hypothetical protein
MNQEQLEIFLADQQTAFRPGQKLRGSVLWVLAKAPRALEIRLFWRTQGKGTEDVGVVATTPVAGPAVAGEQEFEFVLPASPWSFSGKLISLGWGVEVVAEPDGQNALVEFVLAPDAREILLRPIDDAASA